jgi:hypothetical protein
MVASPIASAHPCCPKSGPPDADHCAQAGCISNVPVLAPESVSSTVEFPVAALPDVDSLMQDSRPEWAAVPVIPLPGAELFLRHQQFLI